MDQGSVVEDEGGYMNPFDDTELIKVITCEPSAGLIDARVYDNRIDFYLEQARLESRSKFKFFTGNTGRMAINYARETMADQAIKSGMDFMLMIDDDQLVPKDLFERLYKTMEATKADVVSPMVTQRFPPFNPVMWKQSWFDGGKISNQFIEEYEPNSIVECDAVGFGVVLIRAAMLKNVKMPRFFSNTYLGEDIYFCMKAKGDAKAKIVMDTAIKAGHMRHAEVATEYDFVKSKKLEEKFKDVYKSSVAVETIDELNVVTE